MIFCYIYRLVLAQLSSERLLAEADKSIYRDPQTTLGGAWGILQRMGRKD